MTLSYRGDAFGRVKPKNRLRLEQAAAAGRLRVLLESTVTSIERESVVLDRRGKPLRLRNEAVIVCAGGELPTPFLRKIGILVQTHHGEQAAA